MTTPTHIGFAGRKAVIARLLAYEARARNAPDSRSDAAERVLNEMLDSANQATTQPSPKPLDEWLRDAVQSAQNITKARWGSQSRTPAAGMLHDLKEQAAALSCSACANGGQICRGNQRDNQIVAAGGRCLRQVFEAFSEASALAEAYYRTYAGAYRSPPRLILCTSEAAAKPHDIPIGIFIGGETRYADDGSGPLSVVELKIAIGLLDWESWLAVLYLLMHELVCHAYAGSAVPNAPRQGLRSFDPFAEGWMDRVCGMILEDVANNAAPAAGLIRAFKAERSDAGDRFRLHRQRPQRDNGGMAWSVVQSVRAATHTFQALQRLLGNPQRAREAMYRLSLDLNLLDRAVEDRTRIVTVMSRQMIGPEAEHYGMAILSIHQYLNGGAPHELFAELWAL
jgi:hypothetical protein